MTRRPVRIALLFVLVATMGVSAWLFLMAERQGQEQRQLARHFDEGTRAAMLQVAELGRAQQAYVAAGQGEAFWMTRVSALLTDVRARLDALEAAATSSATASLQHTSQALQAFEDVDQRARQDVRGRQRLLASDLIFSDGLGQAQKAIDALGQARVEAQASHDVGIAATARREWFSIGAAGAAALLVALLLLPTGHVRELQPGAALPSHAISQQASGMAALNLPAVPATSAPPDATVLALDAALDGELDEDWKPAERSSPAAPAVAESHASVMPAPPAPAVARPAIDLPAIAALCGDLARISDTRLLPGLLERAAHVLDATGVVLWIADPDARELAPILTHGYPANLVLRLGIIPRDAQNATASAFRTGLLQTVRADSVSNGAVAVPLVTPAGCVGVMAAEVLHDGEQEEARLAAASIISAQLATLVGPPPLRKAEAANA